MARTLGHTGTGPARELVMESVRLSEVARSAGTPCYVYSAEALLSPLRELQKGLAPLESTGPGAPLICFAVKSCPNLSILKLLAAAGAGMDLVSGGELARAIAAGTPGERMVFSGVGKTADEMRAALSAGILAFNAESESELDALEKVAAAENRIARVSLRFNPDVDAGTHPYIATGLKRNKFGLSKKELLRAVERAVSLPHIRVAGISMHIGSQLVSLAPMREAYASLRALLAPVNSRLKAPLEFIDLGGGLGIRYRNEKPPSIADYCKLVVKSFGKLPKDLPPLRILIEPGRLISGPAGVLLTRVLYTKEQGKRRFLICDGAMNDLIRPALYEGFHEIVPVTGPAGGARSKMDVVGPVCESADFLAQDRMLPTRIQEGDLLAVLDAGAYGFSMASNYNSRPRPPEILIEKDRFRVIRPRETLDDLLARERALC